MKRVILLFTTLSFIGVTEAEYMVKIPLNINLKFIKTDNENTTPETPPEIDCENEGYLFPEECLEELNAWENFAIENNLDYDEDWNSIYWISKNLASLPNSAYPNSNIFNGVDLFNNNLTNLQGFNNIETIGTHLYLHSNSLNDLSGLSNLKSIGGHLYLQNNRLTNLNGLNNLEYVGDSILLSANQLTNIDGLNNIQSINGVFSFYVNRLTNLDGLVNLNTVNGNFLGYSNLLTNVNGLQNLMNVGGYMYIHNNRITDITGLSNARVNGSIRIDSTYNGPKMAASSRFCTLNNDSSFPAGYATKSQLCEI